MNESSESHFESGIWRTRRSSGKALLLISTALGAYLLLLAAGIFPAVHERAPAESGGQGSFVPGLWATLPFIALLLAIAILPLLSATRHWWERNQNRFLVAAALSVLTLGYYGLFHPGGIANHFTHAPSVEAGWPTVLAVLSNAILEEFVPFIVLLFSLYVISGGIHLRGDLPAHASVNCAFIGAGTVLASFVGTTGAAMMLIRPLLSTNSERKYRVHTVIFFIFMVCNCGGLLLPIGDPPLFLGYLRGVPFQWTLRLWPYWLGVNLLLLAIYYIWDRVLYSREAPLDVVRDEAQIQRLELLGKLNFVFLAGVVLSVAFLVPGRPLPGTHLIVPSFLRESVMLVLVAASLISTAPEIRLWNRFDYHAITEVAALFSGIFICMQAPIEILRLQGGALGLASPESFFWITGILSSFLDNAPTYVVFFETATAMNPAPSSQLVELAGGGTIVESLLVAISLGAVFMGANTYIGNGPNFMVKSIAEQSGIRMPSFFGYMMYSLLVLFPIFLGLSFLL